MINLEEIKNIMEDARKEHFTDKGLKTMEGIYYMNGNDGTGFDYKANGRVCEFYILKPNDDGLIKFLAEIGNTYTMYIYDYDEPYSGKNTKTITGKLHLSVYDLACHLQFEKDNRKIYDEVMTSWVLNGRTPIYDIEEG